MSTRVVTVALVPDAGRVAAAQRTGEFHRDASTRAEPNVVGVAIDVLRATTTLSVALGQGAARVVPCADPATARALRDAHPDVLACGEREGRIVPGFDLGNSPFEYVRERIEGRTLAFASTNGSFALLDVAECGLRLLGAFVTAAAVVEACAGARQVRVVCAGKEGRPAAEDAACAGWIVSRLRAAGFEAEGREARSVCDQAPRDGREVEERVRRSEHGRVLAAMGPEYARDVEFCAGLDRFDRAQAW